MSSSTTRDFLETVKKRLKAYVDPAGRTVFTLVAGRVYLVRAPEQTTIPYIVLRKVASETDPEFPNIREISLLEVECIGRALDSGQDPELIADVVEAALLTWRESSADNGLSYVEETARDTGLALEDSPDADLVAVTVSVRCISWAKRLTDALT